MAKVGSHILAFDTGQGKTVTTIAALLLRRREGKANKILWVAPLLVVTKTDRQVRKETDFTTQHLQGSAEKIERFSRKDFTTADITFINLEAFDNKEVLEFVRELSLQNFWDTVVIDEAHNIADPFFSNRNAFVYFTAYKIPSVFVLTATPVISKILQYAALVALVRKQFEHLTSIRTAIHAGEFVPEKEPDLITVARRKDKVPSHIITVEVEESQGSATGVTIFKRTRGKHAHQVNEQLINIIKQEGHQQVLVHCFLTENHTFLQKLLQDTFGVEVAIISGKTRNRQQIIDRYNEGEIPIVIYNLAESLDLFANYTIMYDWTVYASQAMGRGLRTEEVGDYKVFFITTSDPKEQSLFENSVIKHNELMMKAIAIQPIHFQSQS